MNLLEIKTIPCLTDNYAYLLRDPTSGRTAVVDPSESEPIRAALQETGWPLHYIFNTHHHWDHTGGNLDLKHATGCQIVGAHRDQARIPGIDVALAEGDEFALGNAPAQILEIPGHTSGHIAFWFPESEALFPGDTLFSIGCGRVFEGTFEQMWQSLDKLRQLPDETRIYCGHEYTVKNAQFALSLEPNNSNLIQRLQDAQQKRASGQPTIPSTIAAEKATNPFLRPESEAIHNSLGLPPDASVVTVFAKTRQAKDGY